MASDHYNKTIAQIQEYFGVSNVCALYMFHRALRSKRKDHTYMQYTVQLQNALVLADKCIGLDWNTVVFGKEEDVLLTHGISILEMSNSVYRHDDLKESSPSDSHTGLSNTADLSAGLSNTDLSNTTDLSMPGLLDNEWEEVKYKKKKNKCIKKHKYLFAHVGIIE